MVKKCHLPEWRKLTQNGRACRLPRMAGFSGKRPARPERADRPEPTARVPEPPGGGSAAPTASPSAPDGPKMRRIAIPVTEDGRLDLDGIDGLRGSTKDALRKALTSDPRATAKLLGTPLDGSVGKPPEFVTPERAERLIDLLSGVLKNTIGRRYPPDIAAEALTYSAADKAVLAPSTAAVLNKYAGPFFSKYGDEIELCGLLISLTYAKIALANTLMEAKEREQRGPAAVIRHTPHVTDMPADVADVTQPQPSIDIFA